MVLVRRAAAPHLGTRPQLQRVPLPQPKPKLLTVKLDNPINQRYVQVFEQAYAARHGSSPWAARLQVQGAGGGEVRIKAADVQTIFSEPQQVVQSVFGPMLRIAQSGTEGVTTHLQVPQAYVANGKSLADVAQHHVQPIEPYGTAAPKNAQRLLGALIEASVHPEVAAALRQLGQGPTMISVASKGLLDEAFRAQGRRAAFVGNIDPAVFLNAHVPWPQVQGSDAGKTQALTAYLSTSEPVDGAVDFLLRGGIPSHETRLKADSQRRNLSTLAVVQQLLEGRVADYAQAWDVAARAYPEGAVQRSQPQGKKIKKTKPGLSNDFKAL